MTNMEEYYDLLASLYEADSRFYASLINIKREQGSNPVRRRMLVGFLVNTHPCEYSPILCDACDATSEERESFAWIVMASRR
jgi:hypothetical protein